MSNIICFQGDPTYPTCLSRCKEFTVGNAQFAPLDATLDVRAGETHRFVGNGRVRVMTRVAS